MRNDDAVGLRVIERDGPILPITDPSSAKLRWRHDTIGPAFSPTTFPIMLQRIDVGLRDIGIERKVCGSVERFVRQSRGRTGVLSGWWPWRTHWPLRMAEETERMEEVVADAFHAVRRIKLSNHVSMRLTAVPPT